MTEILFIAFQYPPINVAGSFRPYMFSKYLPSFDIKPIVITLDPDSQNEYKVDLNSSLLQELPKEVEIHTVQIKKQNNSTLGKIDQIYFNIGDDKYKRWGENALKKIDQIIKANNIKAIYFTAPPFRNGDLAIEVSEKYKLPLILDMRDAWSQWCIAPYASQLHYRKTIEIEKLYFNKANKIIANTNVLKNDFMAIHPEINSEKIEVIHNGFDIDTVNIPTELSPKTEDITNEIKIGYIGTFYYNPKTEKSLTTKWWTKKPYRWFQYFPIKEQWIYRSPVYFYKALHKCFQNNPSLKKKIKIILIGNLDPWLNKMITEYDLEDNFEHRGFIEHSQLKKATEDINYFLVTSAKIDNAEHYAIASKTFDYIKLQRPILAFVSDGAQKTFIKKSNSGYIFDPDNTEESSKLLNKIFNEEKTLTLNSSYLSNFTRKNGTKKLAEIILNLKK